MCMQEGKDPEDEDTPDVVLYLLIEHYTMNLSQYARKIMHSTDKRTGRSSAGWLPCLAVHRDSHKVPLPALDLLCHMRCTYEMHMSYRLHYMSSSASQRLMTTLRTSSVCDMGRYGQKYTCHCTFVLQAGHTREQAAEPAAAGQGGSPVDEIFAEIFKADFCNLVESPLSTGILTAVTLSPW
jgi:hypothetical protein